MTCYLNEESVSSLKDGIETIVVPIHDPHDMEQLVFHTQRGGVYDVVEWLLSELYRQTELERVVGLTVTPSNGQVVVNLELKQPGLQLEQWLRHSTHGMELTPKPEGNVEATILVGAVVESRELSVRSMATGKFTNQYRPWWEAQVQEIVPQLEQEVPTG